MVWLHISIWLVPGELFEEPIPELDVDNTQSMESETPNTDPILSNTENTQDCELTLSIPEQNPDKTTNKELDKDILELLGVDPSSTVQYGEEIHKELATRLQHITVNGLTKEARKELSQKYLLPSNGILLGAPAINLEIKAALPETLIARDKAIEAKQKLLASAISCIASATSSLLEPNNQNKELLKKLIDANKLLCDIQHSDSVTRRMFSSSVLKKDVKSQITNSKIDKYLFGENLADTLKTAKAVSKSSAEIKNTTVRKDKRPQPQPSTSKSSNLNSKVQVAPTRRPPVSTRKTQPTFHQNRPGGSSKTSYPQQKTTNYRRQ